MIKLSHIKPGDLVLAEYEGQQVEGVVKDLNREDKEICVDTGVQEFWYTPEHLFPIPLDEKQLTRLGFQKEVQTDGTVKYKKDSFRLLVPRQGDFSAFEIWWREDRR
ncbi:MAG: hypothetical protein ACKO6K_09210, partial [Chitinophagaceae bacterium]